MGAGEALPDLQLGLAVGALVLKHRLKEIPGGGQGVGHGAHRGIAQVQLLTPAGEVGMDGGGHLPEPL